MANKKRKRPNGTSNQNNQNNKSKNNKKNNKNKATNNKNEMNEKLKQVLYRFQHCAKTEPYINKSQY